MTRTRPQRARYIEPVAVCVICGRERRCRGAKTDTPVCNTCRRADDRSWTPPIRVCSACGQTRPCSYAHTEHPMCRSCAARRPSRRELCAFCGKVAIAAARTAAGAECGNCRWRRMHSTITCERCHRHARPSASQPGVCERCACERVAQICQQCGAEEQNYTAGRCGACSLRARIDELVRIGDPAAVSALSGYLGALASSGKPLSTLNWMTTSRGYETLERLVGGEIALTHDALDSVNATDHLRGELVNHGALPVRSEPTARLKLLIGREVLRVPDGPDRLHLRTFATWKVHHDLARKERQGVARRHSDMGARVKVRVAADLLVWLAEREITLQTLQQEHLDWWLADGAEHRKRVRAFITWTIHNKITAPLTVHAPATLRHVDPMDPDRRRQLLRTLLTDDQLDLRDRVAGLLIILCSQRISHLVLLTSDAVQERDDGQVLLAVGRDPLLLPEPLATLTRQLKHATSSQWLFHGGRGGNHLSEVYLRERLRKLGVKSLPARAAATTQLARRLPAAVLADLLGFADTTTERWTRLAAGDWTRYAAHRPTPTTDTAHGAGDPHSTVALRAPAP